MLNYAIRLYDLNIITIPVTLPSKQPAPGLMWGAWKDGVPRDVFIETWTKHYRDGMGMAVVCSDVELFDIDTKNDPEHTIHTRVYDAMKVHLPPETFAKMYIQESPSGGYHFWYRVVKTDIMGPIPDLARIEYTADQRFELAMPPEKSNIGVIVETKGYGGYGLIAPSAGYKVLQGDIEHLPILSSDERELVLMIGRSFNQYEPEAQMYTSNGYAPTASGSRPGDIYNQKIGPMELVSLLESYGWRRLKQLGDSIFMGRPGAKHAHKHDGKVNVRLNCFVNYSSSVQHFNVMKGYSPYYVYAYLAHNGNLQDTTRDLAAKGFEDPEAKAKYNSSGVAPYVPPNYDEEPDENDDAAFLESLSGLRFSLKNKPNIDYTFFIIDPRNPLKQTGVGFPGSIIAIYGQAKSRKTTLLSTMIASVLARKRVENFLFNVSGNVLWIDTEQGDLYFWETIRRLHIQARASSDEDRLYAYKFVDMTYKERIAKADRLISILKPAVIVIDGIVDFMRNMNDETESQEIVQRLRGWGAATGAVIFPVLHLNPSSKGYETKARGHIGTILTNKCDSAIEASADKGDERIIKVRNSYSRGPKFNAFEMKAGRMGVLYTNEMPEYNFEIGGTITAAELSAEIVVPEPVWNPMNVSPVDRTFGADEDIPF